MKARTLLELAALSTTLYTISKETQVLEKLGELSEKGKKKINSLVKERVYDDKGNEMEFVEKMLQKAKEAKKFIEELKTGDKVVTIGGAHGTVISIREKTIVVEVDSSKGVRMVFEKTAISKDASSRLEE